MKTILKLLLALLLVAVLAAGGYVGYVALTYSRIADYTPLEQENPQESRLSAGGQYTALTYNIGFGAYGQGFSFFMDRGRMADGTATKGESSRAESAAAVRANTQGVAGALTEYNPDFVLLQEVDTDSDRSHHVNQVEHLASALPGHGYVYAANLHSPYLLWPPTSPIGAMESGLVSFSRFAVNESVRRSYPVDDSFPDKLFDLDRCFTAQWLPVDGGTGDLVLINTHMSAYDEGGAIRTQQLQLLMDMVAGEYAKGNYVIVGGDFNHALGVALDAFASGQQVPDWVMELDLSVLPEGFYLVQAANTGEVPTCRGADIPYTRGVTYTTVVDGFFVSANVSASAFNIDLDFVYSDHNPVQLTFTLAPGEEGSEEPSGEAPELDAGGEEPTEEGETADEGTPEPLG